MRLLHVIPGLDPRSGGTVSALVGLAIAQCRLGWQVSVLTTASGPDHDPREILRLQAAGVSVTTVTVASRLSSIKTIRQAAAAAVAGADWVHVHAVWEELQHQVCLAAHRASVPFFVSPHGMLDPWSLAQGRLKKRAYLALRLKPNLDRAAAIHCTTLAEAKLLAPLRIAAPTFVIPNGIDLTEFESAGGDCERKDINAFVDRFPMVRGKRCLILLSRLHPKKGLDLLLPAFARLVQADRLAPETRLAPESWVLVLAGPGEPRYIDSLRGQCERMAISDRVVFTGMLNGAERVAALRAADLFVLPSYQKNFGIAVIESLAAGTPVIISDQVNLAEEIRGSGVGQVVTTVVDDVHQAIVQWVSDTARCREAGELGKKFATRYDFATVAQAWKHKLENHADPFQRREKPVPLKIEGGKTVPKAMRVAPSWPLLAFAPSLARRPAVFIRARVRLPSEKLTLIDSQIPTRNNVFSEFCYKSKLTDYLNRINYVVEYRGDRERLDLV